MYINRHGRGDPVEHIAPSHSTVESDGSVDSYRAAGQLAGNKAGEDLRKNHHVLSTKDPAVFFFGLGRAQTEAMQQMRGDGARDEYVEAWLQAFDLAFAEHREAWGRIYYGKG